MDRPAIIEKTDADLRVRPNFSDYDGERARFRWQAAADGLAGLPGGGLNIAHEAVDRHASGPLRDKTALRFVCRSGPALDVSYDQLRRDTARFANVLRALGVGPGDRVYVLAGRIPALYVAILGALKNGSVVTPLFSAFGPEPIATRANIGKAKVLVTTDLLYRRKVAKVRAQIPTLQHVLLVAEEGGQPPSRTPSICPP